MAKHEHIQVVLVRSGRTNWDESGRLSGQCDHPLTDEGRAGVVSDLDAADPGVQLGLVLCAHDEASVGTAQILAERAGGRVKELDGLQEMHFGLWSGLMPCDLEDKYPSAYKQWAEDPGSVNIPDGETLGEAEDRVLTALSKSLSKARDEDQPIGIVLRPVAFALVEAWLSGRKSTDLWSIVEDGPRLIRHAVPRALLKETRERSRAGL
jgi:broad specificity phosphatase PhoE